MQQGLFLHEVLEARRSGWLGATPLTQPLRLWVLTSVAVITATSIALILVLGTYTHRSHVAGQLVPLQGIAAALASAIGVVTRVDVPVGGRTS